MDTTGKACHRYNLLTNDRDVYLTKAREASRYTIPSLIPPQEQTQGTDFYKPWQSLGARGVRNLASKLLLTLFPTTQAFFRLTVSPKLQAQIPEQDRDSYDQGLSKIERSISREFDARAFRSPIFETLKHLIVGGNAALHVPDKGQIKLFTLSQYVCRRDREGNILELCIKESVDVEALPSDVRDAVRTKIKSTATESSNSTQPTSVDVYTWVVRESDRYKVSQEAAGIAIPTASGFYPIDRCPWIVLRWTRIDGENYGRSLCEEIIGDLRSFEHLSQARVEAAAISARCLFLTRPGSVTDVKELTKAPNGSFVVGNPEDIVALQAERFADMQVADKLSAELEQRLSYSFLLNSAVQRDAERVTAEEIRYMAQELESSLGGVYSVLATEFQAQLIRTMLVAAQKRGDLPTLPDIGNGIDMTVTTGFDAVGRTSDAMRLNELLGQAAQLLGPALLQYVSASNYLKRCFASYGLDSDGLIRSEQDVADMNNVQSTTDLAKAAAPNIVKAISDHAALAQQQPQTQPNA